MADSTKDIYVPLDLHGNSLSGVSQINKGTSEDVVMGDGSFGKFPEVPTALSDLQEDAQHRLVTDTEKNTWNNKYNKPSTGIPKQDLSLSVRVSLGKADTALQSETDPTVPSWAKQASKPSYTAQEVGAQETLVSGVNIKTINGNTILGSGDLEISTGDTDAVKYVEQSLTSGQQAQARTNIGAGTYSKPSSGIPASDIASGVIPDVSQFITKSVNDLTNYYLKSETYTKEEVQQLISTIQGFSFEVVSVLPTASADTMGKIYLVPSADPQTQNVKDEYITIESSGSYAWEIIGSTSIDLSGYVTTTQLNTALAAYTTSADLTTLLSGKQDTIFDLSDIRSGAEAGATAYQKPSTGIPATDIASGVIPTVNNATLTVKMNNVSKGTFTANASSDVEIDLGTVITSHQDITGKENISNKVSSWSSTTTNEHYPSEKLVKDSLDDKYEKPSGGIPSSDMASAVQTSLGKADTALQSYTETDPTVPAWAKAANKPSYDYSEIGNTPTIPDELADLADDSTHRLVTDTEKSTWNAKQAALVSGTNIKTINNESLLGSGNITIQGGGGISTITLTFTPNEGDTYFGTKAQAATALGITENEVDSLMAGDYDRLIFNGLYADKSTPGQVTSDAAYQRYVAADYNGVPYSLYLIYEDGGYSCWWEREVPALSTSIYSDGNSTTKAATPKAVKDYIDDLPIPRQIILGAFTPTESSSYISLGNASAAAASLNIEEEELYNLYDGAYNRLLMYDTATAKVRIAHDALRIDEGGGATYEILAPDGTPYVLDFLYESSAYKYRYYSVVGDIATILASI